MNDRNTLKPDYKGHESLAAMILTHIPVWKNALNRIKVNLPDIDGFVDDEDSESYYDHELKALDDIEAAAKVELELDDLKRISGVIA